MKAIHDKLKRILEYKSRQTTANQKILPLSALQRMVDERTTPKVSLAKSLGRGGVTGPALIAEFKKASPSAGVINADMSADIVANAYTHCGASAISVLTENKYFMGGIEDLMLVKNSTSLPVLRKDFLTNIYEVVYSAAFGADAVLLIAAVLDPILMKDMYDTAYGLGLECLVEVHNLQELELVSHLNAKIIGVNNRDLISFEVDIDNFGRISDQIPNSCIKIAESGLRTRADIDKAAASGANAVLIGGAFGQAEDITLKLNELGFGL